MLLEQIMSPASTRIEMKRLQLLATPLQCLCRPPVEGYYIVFSLSAFFFKESWFSHLVIH